MTTYTGSCLCGGISWKVTGKVNFTSACHCKSCQKQSGSAQGTTSLMIYDADGVEFSGNEAGIWADTSEQGNSTERGFCKKCGTVLFNHVSRGKPDEHWAIRTGAIDGPSPKMEKQIFMRSKPDWVPDAASESHETMPG